MKKLFLFFVFISLFFCFQQEISAEAADPSPVSPALSVLSSNVDMAKAGLCGKDLVFSEDDFCRALNLSKINYITVTSLPDPASGRLVLGTTAVTAGQRISRSNLPLMVFVPSSSAETETVFSFMPEDRGYKISCRIYALKNANSAPISAHASDISLKISVYSGDSAVGRLSGYDPEGDAVSFEIIKYPYHGLLKLNSASSGSYTYYPKTGFSGGDSFSYVVKDIYGNYSASRTVILTVSEPPESAVFSDLSGHIAKGSAIDLFKAGIMKGTDDGAFEPEGSVSREELLVMTMKAAGIYDLPKATSTVFYDDADISVEAKPYVAAAYQLGYIKGEARADGKLVFSPKAKVTRADAALLADSIIGASAIVGDPSARPVYKDISSIPSSAWAALSNLHLLGLIDDTDGSINANARLSRADAAIMLAGVMKLTAPFDAVF